MAEKSNLKMKEKIVNRLKISFSSSFLIAGMFIIHYNLYKQLYSVLALQLIFYFIWLTVFPFVKSLYKEYKLFLIGHLIGAFVLGILPSLSFHLVSIYKGYVDVLIILGAISIMLISYKYCQDDKLLKVGWIVVDIE